MQLQSSLILIAGPASSAMPAFCCFAKPAPHLCNVPLLPSHVAQSALLIAHFRLCRERAPSSWHLVAACVAESPLTSPPFRRTNRHAAGQAHCPFVLISVLSLAPAARPPSLGSPSPQLLFFWLLPTCRLGPLWSPLLAAGRSPSPDRAVEEEKNSSNDFFHRHSHLSRWPLPLEVLSLFASRSAAAHPSANISGEETLTGGSWSKRRWTPSRSI